MRDFMNRLHIHPQLYLLLALGFLLLPLPWILAWMAASAFHELCHYGALRLCGYRVYRLGISPEGAVMDTEPMSRVRELICALAGPLGGFALLLVARWFPRTALCGAFQSLYNLLPIYPLDGGRALRCLLGQWPEICGILETCVLLGLLILGMIACFLWHLGPIPLLFACVLLIRRGKIKIPCKLGLPGVQ